MTDKMTNVKALELAIATLKTVEGFDTDAMEKLGNIKSSYVKKASAERKETETQKENKVLQTRILGLMEDGVKYTASDLCKLLGNEYSNQKVANLANAMVEDKRLTKSTDKRKSYFAKA